MKKLLKKIFRGLDNGLRENVVLTKLISWQHRVWPMPLSWFDHLFRSGWRRRLFNSYGSNVFRSSYHQRGDDQLAYWLSRESLYWHFWRRTDTEEKILEEIFSLASIGASFQNPYWVACELGFGLGKNYASILRKNNLKKYLAVEPNQYLCEYSKREFASDKNLEIINATAQDFLKQDSKFDILLCFNAVLMYLAESVVDDLFTSLPGRGVKLIIIVNEGTPNQKDIHRSDGTIIYNLKKRLLVAGYHQNFIEKTKSGAIYRYFVMLPAI